MALEMVVERVDAGTAVAVISGALTMGTNLKTIDHNLQDLVSSGVSRLVLDLSASSYCDSAGLGLLMHVNGLLAGHGGAMRLCGVSERLMALLKLTLTDALLKCDADRDTSLLALDAEAM